MHTKAAVILSLYALASGAEQCNDGSDSTSLVQLKTQLKTRQPYGPAPRELQAPPEGGLFSKFFNERTVGHGIHKWLPYFQAYQQHFAQFIGKEVHIMEIGIQSGGSLDMWKSVFGPGARVYGGDINPPCKNYEDNVTKVFIGDQASPVYWENVKKQVPRIDILIDDGGHMVDQQIATLGLMLENLSPNGIYVTEDVHGKDNAFWQSFRLNKLDSPGGNLHYSNLGRLINSVHVYPYLLVIERNANKGPAEMFRQVGAGVPASTHTAVLGGPAETEIAGPIRFASPMELGLQDVFPWADWQRKVRIEKTTDLSLLTEVMPSKSWLVVRDGDSDLSFDGAWDDKADEFMQKSISDFKLLHDGNCCNWESNTMQKRIESLHIYPHLLIVKRTDGGERVVKAPQHGTSWIPYTEAQLKGQMLLQKKDEGLPELYWKGLDLDVDVM